MILVTGGTGHTGRRLVRTLADRGEVVRVLTRGPERVAAGPVGAGRVEAVAGDLTDSGSVAPAFAGCDAVVAMTHIRMAPQVIAGCRAAGVRRALFMSSTRRFTRFPEETARQVIAGEDAVRASGLDWTIIRPSMIYGSDADNNLVHLQRALERWPLHPLPAGGRMLWQPVFTWHVVAALVAALDRPVAVGRDYTIAGPEPVAYRDMVRTMLRHMGRRRLLVPVLLWFLRGMSSLLGAVMRRPPLTGDQIDRLHEDKVFDISDARRDLGFDPVSFDAGIARKIAGDV